MASNDTGVLELTKDEFKKHFATHSIEFQVFVIALLLAFIWVVYVSLYNARVCGWLVTLLLSRFLPKGAQLRFGSFTFSALGGKILFRDVHYITTDYSVRIGDGYLLFRYWLPYLNNSLQNADTPVDVEANASESAKAENGAQTQPALGDYLKHTLCGNKQGKTRVKIAIDCFDLHIYNRSETYTRLFQLFGIDDPRWVVPPKPTFDSSQQPAEQQNESFMTNTSWDFRRLCPVTKCTIYGMRIVFGHARMRTNLALMSNEARIVYDFPSAESPFDEFTHRMQCALSGACLTFLFTNAKRDVVTVAKRGCLARLWSRARGWLSSAQVFRRTRSARSTRPGRADTETVSNENERVSLVGSDLDSEDALRDDAARTDGERQAAGSFDDLDALLGRSHMQYLLAAAGQGPGALRSLDVVTTDACEVCMHMDQPGKVPREPERVQLIGGDFVVRPSFARWTIDVRCVKQTHVAYGPLFDAQRDAIYKFLFPPDFHSQTPTHMPTVGQTRTYKSLDIRIDFLAPVSVDVIFNGRESASDDDGSQAQRQGMSTSARSHASAVGSVRSRVGGPRPTHTLHVVAQKGSYLTMTIPWLVTKAGTRTELRGALQCVDATTSLAFRQLLEADTCQFALDIHRPLGWNDEQHYALSVELASASLSFVMEHVRFFADLGLDWASDDKADILNFVPTRYTVDFRFRRTELLTLVNQYNWVDTECSTARPSPPPTGSTRHSSPPPRRSPESDENTYLAICVEQLDVGVLVPFDEFLPSSVTYTVQLHAVDASGWLLVPESSTGRLLLLSTAENLRLLDRNGNPLSADRRSNPPPPPPPGSSTAFGPTSAAPGAYRRVRQSSGAIECLRTAGLNMLLTYTARPNPVVDDVCRFHPPNWTAKAPFEPASRPRSAFDARPKSVFESRRKTTTQDRPRPKSAAATSMLKRPIENVGEFLRNEFDPSYLEPDLLKLQLDVGPQSSLFLHGAFLRSLWNLKMNYFGTDDRVAPFTPDVQPTCVSSDRARSDNAPHAEQDGDGDGATCSSEPADLAHFDPRKYRPLHTHLQIVVRDIQAHLVRPCATDDAPCACLFLKQLVFEMQKEYRETQLQLMLPPALIWCAPGRAPADWSAMSPDLLDVSGAQDADADADADAEGVGAEEQLAAVSDGFLVLCGLQFRGHGMFSRVGLPLAVDTVEYGWLMDVQVGTLLGRFTASQLVHLVSAVDLAIFAIENAENELQPVRDRDAVECHHGYSQADCSAYAASCSGRVLDDAATNRSISLCPTSEELKYEMTRLRLDALNLFIVDAGCALNLRIDKPIRVATCNLHSEHNKAGVTAIIDTLVLRQLIVASTRPPAAGLRRSAAADTLVDARWLLVGEMRLGPLNVDAGIALPSADMLALQTSFLRKHDSATRRLTFLWPSAATSTAVCVCGCVGGCVFFGRDEATRTFYTQPRSALQDAAASWAERDRVTTQANCVRNGESLLNRNELLFRVVARMVTFLAAFDIPRCHFEREDGDAVLVRLESHAATDYACATDTSHPSTRRHSTADADLPLTLGSRRSFVSTSAAPLQPLVGGVKRQSVSREPGSTNAAHTIDLDDTATPKRSSTVTNSTDTSTLVDETALGRPPLPDDDFDTQHYADPRWSLFGSSATGLTYRTAASDGFSSVMRATNSQRPGAASPGKPSDAPPRSLADPSEFASVRSATTFTSRGAYSTARSTLSGAPKRSVAALTASSRFDSRTSFFTADDAEYYSAEEDPDADAAADDAEKRSLATRSNAPEAGGNGERLRERGEPDASLRRHSLDVLNRTAALQPETPVSRPMNVPEPLRFSMNVNVNLVERSSATPERERVLPPDADASWLAGKVVQDADWLAQNRDRLAQIMPHLFSADEDNDEGALSSVSSESTLSLPSSVASDLSLPRVRSAASARARRKSRRSAADRLDTLNLHEHMNKRITHSPILLNAYERHLAAFRATNWNGWTCQTNRVHMLTLFHDTHLFARWPNAADISDLSGRTLPQFELLRAGFSASLMCCKPDRVLCTADEAHARIGALGDVLGSNPEDSMSVSVSAASQLGDAPQPSSNMMVSRTTAIVRVDEAVRILLTPLVLEAAERYVASLKRAFDTLHVYTVFNQLHAKCVHAVLAKNKLKKEKFRSKHGLGDDLVTVTGSSVDDLLSSVGPPRPKSEYAPQQRTASTDRQTTYMPFSSPPNAASMLAGSTLSQSQSASVGVSERPASLLFGNLDGARLDASLSAAAKSNRVPITHASRRLQIYFSVSQINICFLQTAVLEDAVSLASISPTEVRELVGVCLASFCIDSVQCQVLTDHQSRKRSSLTDRQRKLTSCTLETSTNGGSRSALDEPSRANASATGTGAGTSEGQPTLVRTASTLTDSARHTSVLIQQCGVSSTQVPEQILEQIEATNGIVGSTSEMVTEDDVGVVQFRHIHAQLRRLTRQTNFSRNVQVTALPNQRSRVLFSFQPTPESPYVGPRGADQGTRSEADSEPEYRSELAEAPTSEEQLLRSLERHAAGFIMFECGLEALALRGFRRIGYVDEDDRAHTSSNALGGAPLSTFTGCSTSPSTDGDQPEHAYPGTARRELSGRSVDLGRSELEGDGTLCQFELKQFWFNFAAPTATGSVKAARNRASIFTRYDWNLLSTAATLIRAWMTPTDRLIVSARVVQSTLVRRIFATMVCCMVNAKDYPGVKGSREHSVALGRLTELAHIVRDDPSVQVFAILRRYVLKRGVAEIDALLSHEPPSLEALEKGIRALTREWKTFVDVPFHDVAAQQRRSTASARRRRGYAASGALPVHSAGFSALAASDAFYSTYADQFTSQYPEDEPFEDKLQPAPTGPPPPLPDAGADADADAAPDRPDGNAGTQSAYEWARLAQLDADTTDRPVIDSVAQNIRVKALNLANLAFQATSAQVLFRPLLESMSLHIQGIKATPLMKQFGGHFAASARLRELRVDICDSYGNPMTLLLTTSQRSVGSEPHSPTATQAQPPDLHAQVNKSKAAEAEHTQRPRRRKPRVRFDSGSHSAALLCERFEAAVSIRDVIDFNDDADSPTHAVVPTSPVRNAPGVTESPLRVAANDSPSVRFVSSQPDRVLFTIDSPKRTRVAEQHDDLEVRRTTTVVHFDFGIDSIEKHVDMTLLRLASQFVVLASHISGSKTEIEHKRVELQSQLFRKTHRKQESKGSSISTGLTTSSTVTVPPPTDTHTVTTASAGGQPMSHADARAAPDQVDRGTPAQEESGLLQPSANSGSSQQSPDPGLATSGSDSDGLAAAQVHRRPGSSFRRTVRVGEYGPLRSSRTMRRKRELANDRLPPTAEDDASQSQSQSHTDSAAPFSNALRVWQRMNAIIELYSHAPETKTFDRPVANRGSVGTPAPNRQTTFMGIIGSGAGGQPSQALLDEADTKVVLRRRQQPPSEPPSGVEQQPQTQPQPQTDEVVVNMTEPHRSPLQTANRQSLFAAADAPVTMRRTAAHRAAGEQMHVRLPPAAFGVLSGSHERVSIALVGATRVRRLRVTAAISGLKFEADVTGIAASVTHSTRIDSLFVRTALSSAAAHVGCVMLTLKEGPRTREAIIVSVAVRNTDGLFATRSRRSREHNSASGVCEAIEIDIPHHPVALHGMVTRSQKHLTSTIQEILRYAPPSTPSAPPTASTNTDSAAIALDAIDGDQPNSIANPLAAANAAATTTAQSLPLPLPADGQTQLDEAPSSLVPPATTPTERSASVVPRLPTRTPSSRTPVVYFNVKISQIALGAAVLPSVKAQYRVGPISTHGVSGNRATFYVDVPSHSLNFSATLAGMPSSTSLDFPAIAVRAEYRSAAASGDAPLGATPKRRTGLFTDRLTMADNDVSAPFGDRSPARPAPTDGSYLHVTANVELFEYSVTADLLNHLIFAQKVFMKEINEVIQKVSGDDDDLSDSSVSAQTSAAAQLPQNDANVAKTDDDATTPTALDRQFASSSVTVAKKEPVVYRMEVRFRGISISATTASATPSAVRLDTSEIVLSLNNCTPPTDTVLASLPADVIDLHKLFAEMKVDVTLALGQIVRLRTASAASEQQPAPAAQPTSSPPAANGSGNANTGTNADEQSGEFVPQAFFKTHIELCNSRPGEMWLLLQRSFAEFESAAQQSAPAPTSTPTPASGPAVQRPADETSRRTTQFRAADEANRRRTESTNAKRLPPFLAKFQHAEHDAVYVTLRRPIVYLHAAAVDQAMMIWLNYKHAYDYWMEQTSELHGAEMHRSSMANLSNVSSRYRTRSSVGSVYNQGQLGAPSGSSAAPQSLQSTSILFLQLTVEQLGACFPLGPNAAPNRTTTPTANEAEGARDRNAKSNTATTGRASLIDTRFARFPFARASTASLPVTSLEQSTHKRTTSPDGLETGHALVLTLETTRISACSAGEFVSRGIFQNFCLRFADQFDANAEDWRPPEAIRSQLLLNAAVIPQGTYEVCSTTVSRSHHSASVVRNYNLQSMLVSSSDLPSTPTARASLQLRAKWILNFAWHMKGIEMHLDTSIGKRLSVLIDTMTSVALTGNIDEYTPTGSRSSRSASNAQSQQSTLRRESHLKRPSVTNAADLETVYEGTRSGEFVDALDTTDSATVFDVDLDIAFVNDESLDLKTRVQMLDTRILEQQRVVNEMERSRSPAANANRATTASVYELARSVLLPEPAASSAIEIESQKLQRLQQVRIVLTKRDVFFHRTRPKGLRLIRDTLSLKPSSHRRSKSLAHSVFNPQQLATQCSLIESGTLERISESVIGLNNDQLDAPTISSLTDAGELHTKHRTNEPPSSLLARSGTSMRRSISTDEDADGLGVRMRAERGRQALRKSGAESRFVTALGNSQTPVVADQPAGSNSAPKIGFELDLRISIESGKWYLHPRVQAVASVQDRQAALNIVQKTFGKQVATRANEMRARQSSNTALFGRSGLPRGSDKKTEKGMIALDPLEITDPQVQYGFMVQRFKQHRTSTESEINVFIFPGVRFNMHYSSRSGVRVVASPETPLALLPTTPMPPSSSSSLRPAKTDASGAASLNVGDRLEPKTYASSVIQNAHLYAFFAIEKLGEDIVVTPALLDFLEQVIEPIDAPTNLLIGGRHRTSNSNVNVNDDGSALLRGSTNENDELSPDDDDDANAEVSLLAAASIPIDVVVYIRIEPSCIRCGTYPVSRVEMLLKWPLVEVVLSSKRADFTAIDSVSVSDSSSSHQVGTSSSSGSHTSASSKQNTSSSSSPTPLAAFFAPADLRRISALQVTEGDGVDSSKQPLEQPIEGGLSITACLSDLSFNVFHPYRGAHSEIPLGLDGDRPSASSSFTSDSRDRDSLSMCVTFVKVNVSRTRKLQHVNTATLAASESAAGAATNASNWHSLSVGVRGDSTARKVESETASSPGGALRGDVTNAVRFSAVCHIGTASFDFDFRRLVEIRAIPKAWFRPALARFVFLGDPSLLEEGAGAPLNTATKKQQARTPSPTRAGRTPTGGNSARGDSASAQSDAQNAATQTQAAPASGEPPSWARHHRRASSGDKWKFVSALQTQPTLSQQQRRFDDASATPKQTAAAGPLQTMPSASGPTKKRRSRVSWQTLVLVSVDFSKLDVKVNVGNVMGIVMWNTSALRTHGRFTLDSAGNRLSKLSTVLERSSITAQGGIVGGLFEISDVDVYTFSLERSESDPEDRVVVRLACLETRIDYLSTSILTARITQFEANLHDEWTIRLPDTTAQAPSSSEKHSAPRTGAAAAAAAAGSVYNSLPRNASRFSATPTAAAAGPMTAVSTGSTSSLNQRQPTAIVFLHGRLKWDRLDLLVSRSTTPELMKIHRKIDEFFTKQIEESKRDLIGTFSKSAANRIMSRGTSIRGGRGSYQSSFRRAGDTDLRRDPSIDLRRESSEPREMDSRLTWQRILTFVSSSRLRFRNALIPLNSLMAGGTLTLEGRQLKIACFHGITFKAHQWAVFALNEALITFSTDAQLEPLGNNDSQSDKRTHLIQNLELVLGRNGVRQRTEARMAFIDKLVCSHSVRTPQQESSVADWIAYAFNESSRYGHQTEPIFTLPSLLLHLLTEQHERWSVSSTSSNASLATPGTPHSFATAQSPMSQATIVASPDGQSFVKCSFWTQFDSHIEVSVDPETIMFIRDVISGYVKDTERIGQKTASLATASLNSSSHAAADQKLAMGTSQSTTATRLSNDTRQYAEPNPFILEPKIMLITPIANVVPPGSEKLLRHLGFQHGRTTIPKWMQRGFMDPLNDAIALGVQQLVRRFVEAAADAQRGSGSQSGSQQALRGGSSGSNFEEQQTGSRAHGAHSQLHTVKE